MFVTISYTTSLSFAKERIGPLAAIITTVFYLLALYLFALSNTPKNLFASIYSETLIKTTSQHLLRLIGFDTLIYQKYYDTPPILVGHQLAEALALRRAVEFALEEGVCNAVFESDCLSLISRINSGMEDRSSVGIIVVGIKHLVKDFTSVSFRHVRRALNEAAHLLAKSCVNVNSSFIFHSVSEFLRGTFCIDV
jgi:hypothetical protein